MQLFCEPGLICAVHILGVTSDEASWYSPHHAAPARPPFILIKYRSSDVRVYCWHRGPLSHSEVMQRGETEGSLLHNGLINMRTLSLIWFNNCSRIFSVLCWLLGEHTFHFLLFFCFLKYNRAVFFFFVSPQLARARCAWCTEMASVYTICNCGRFLLDFWAFTFQRYIFFFSLSEVKRTTEEHI